MSHINYDYLTESMLLSANLDDNFASVNEKTLRAELQKYRTGGILLLGSAAATVSGIKDSTKLFGDIRENPGYFLWKIDKKNKKKW